MAFFNRNHDDDDLGTEAGGPNTDGLPDGVDRPPVPPLPGEDLHATIERNVRSGIPGSGHPSRPLAEEEAAVHLFNAFMWELTNWAARTRIIIPALIDAAAERRNLAESDFARVTRKIEETEADIEAQRDQMVDRELRFPLLVTAVNGLLIAFAVALGYVEVLGLKPVIGQVVGMGPKSAWYSAVGVVGLSVLAAWELGSRLHKWVTYEGPARVRKTYGWWVALLGVAELFVLAGIIYMRLQLHSENVTSPLSGAIIYVGVQALAILTAAGHGWRLNNPRTQELAHSEAHLKQLQQERNDREDDLTEARIWAESLGEFRVGDWLSQHRAQIAEDFARDVLEYRAELGQSHLEAGNDEAYTILLILPLPKFVPPVDTDPDDPGDWINGFMLPL